MSKVKDLFEHLQSWIFSCNSPEVDEFLDFDGGAPNNQPELPDAATKEEVKEQYSRTKDKTLEPCPICKSAPDLINDGGRWRVMCSPPFNDNKWHEIFIYGISKKSVRLKWNNFVRKVERDLQWA